MQKATIPLFKELGDPLKKVEMYVFPFHEKYDGLIGNNILIPLKSKIDFENQILVTKDKETKLHFNSEPEQFNYKIETKGEFELNIPVLQKEGLAYLPEQKSSDGKTTMHEGIYNVDNYKINARIRTEDDGNKYLKFNPLQTQVVNDQNFNIIEEEEYRPLLEQVRISHLNAEEKPKFLKIINRFKNIFYNENSDLSFTNAIKHNIRTTDDVPIYAKSYRYPYIHKQEVEEQIEEMLEKGIIQHSNSPYSAPVWIVPKKADASGKAKWRLVIDYRKLNEVTIDDKYPIPNIDEILGKLGTCQYFTTLDLAKGFHQIEIDGQDVHKTAFNVENGHYEFLRMPFGLKTAPATFQRLMNNVLKDYINKICLVYLDDIIIFSASLEEHLDSLTKIFKRLEDVNLMVQLDKSEFLKKETEFLGHIITLDGIRPNPKKIECVKNFPIPKTPKQIKQFLGLTGYYRKFIQDYSKIAKPITKYLKKNQKVNITDPEYISSFEMLKRLLINEPILKYPDFLKTFTVTTDASQYALGAILSQEGHPICYASRTLNDHEQNYSTIEKELLAVVWATKYFRPYVFGRKFLIETDHKPLQWLFSIKEPNSKLVRWRLKLSEFDYEIKYKKGILNGNADALSRIEINLTEQSNIHRIPFSDSPLNVFKTQIAIYKTNSGSLRIKNQKVFDKSRKLIYTKSLDNKDAITLLKSHFNPKSLNAVYIEDSEFFQTLEQVFQTHFSNNKLKIIRCNRILKDITDEENLAKLIEQEHLRNNHRGIVEVCKELQLEYFHPKLCARVSQFINNCEICNIEKYDRKPIKQKFQITETPSSPNQIIHIDVFYSLDKNLFLTFIDKFSKFAQAIRIQARTWVEFKRVILQYISAVGKVKKIIVDNELGFKAIPFQEFLQKEDIEIHFTSNNNHTSNSDVERLHNTINEHIRLLRHDQNKEIDTVEEKILKIISFYNNTIHSTTNRKPIDFNNGKVKDDEYNDIRDRIIKIKEKTISKLNHTREEVEVQSGPIFLKEVRGGKNYPKFRKIEVEKPDENHVINKETGLKYYKSHVKRNKKFQNNNLPTIKAKPKSNNKPKRKVFVAGQNDSGNNPHCSRNPPLITPSDN